MPPPAPASDLPGAAAVIVAAGRGERLGDPAKAMISLAGRPMLAWSLDAIAASGATREIVVVVGAQVREAVERLVAGGTWKKPIALVAGGDRRQDSVAAGVAAASADVPLVVVHDAARPLALTALFERCIEVAARRGAAIAAIPLADTLKRVDGDAIVGTVPRAGLWVAQTPQVFRRAVIAAAIAHGQQDGVTVTDEASLCEALGIEVAVVPGDPTNIKVTHPDDIAVAEALLRARHGSALGAITA